MKNIFFTTAMLALGALLFNSCERVEMPNEIASEQQNQFQEVLRLNMDNIGDIPVGTSSGIRRTPGIYGKAPSKHQAVYLYIPNLTADVQKRVYNVRSLRDISELTLNHGAVVYLTNENATLDIQFTVPVQETQNSLAPMVAEAKRFLSSKGFTGQGIQEMIIAENGTEYDLILVAMLLQEATSSFTWTGNPFIDCALVAIGIDVAWAFMGAGVHSWTELRRLFRTVANRALGPIGAVVALGAYGACLHREGVFN